MKPPSHQALLELGLFLAAALLPLFLQWQGEDFYIGFATRLLIFALAATSLNFIVGYGGMVAFGHAAFFGIGAYVVAFLMKADISSAWLSWPLAMGVTAFLATIIGIISLRTQGVYFIMITLAFAQMIYYSIISMESAGGDDGLSLAQRSSLFPFDLSSDTSLYWLTLTLLFLCLYLLKQLRHSRYGRALAGLRQNELRMEALGYPVLHLKLVCFVAGSVVCCLAGALLANQNGLASPNQLYWTQSGMLLVMVILGGTGYRYGGVLGAVGLLSLEEIFTRITEHGHLFIGLVMLAIVLYAPRGLAGIGGRQP
jgi:branched-chain amino acid transport system permease protein